MAPGCRGGQQLQNKRTPSRHIHSNDLIITDEPSEPTTALLCVGDNVPKQCHSPAYYYEKEIQLP